jgi:hypothetical protein
MVCEDGSAICALSVRSSAISSDFWRRAEAQDRDARAPGKIPFLPTSSGRTIRPGSSARD